MNDIIVRALKHADALDSVALDGGYKASVNGKVIRELAKDFEKLSIRYSNLKRKSKIYKKQMREQQKTIANQFLRLRIVSFENHK